MHTMNSAPCPLEMDGIEFCKYVKGNLEISHIPVILLTAKNKEEDRAEAYEELRLIKFSIFQMTIHTINSHVAFRVYRTLLGHSCQVERTELSAFCRSNYHSIWWSN